MKKHFLFFIALILTFLSTSAQNQQIIVGKNYVQPNEVTLVAEQGTSTTIKFDLNELNFVEVETDYGTAVRMSSAKAPVMLEAGAPELLYLPTAIIIPDRGSAELSITYSKYIEIENVEVAPSKGNLKRSVDPSTVPYIKGEVYNINAFFPEVLAELNEPFIMRDVRGQSIFVYPVQYNPVTKVLRIYSEMTVTVNYTDQPGENEFINQKRNTAIDPTFSQMYSNMFINNSSVTRGYPTGEEGDLLIISAPDFMDAMKPYVDWKRTIGRKTTLVSTATAGTTVTAIKSYVSNFYNNPENDLAYLLLVGDLSRIPMHTYNNPDASGWPPPDPTVGSDNHYGQLVGSDLYMEVLVGRFSAETVAQVQTQVQRSIWYERDITTADTWLGTGIGIARNEGGIGAHDGQENDYVHMNNIRNRMLAYGYDPVYQEYGGNCPGVPNTSAAQISQRFNGGASMTNYINHGHVTSWSVGGYNNSHVSQLQNAGKLSYIFSVACLNGRIKGLANQTTQTCMAETWMRATQSSQPTGAVATLMATISIGWGPPMTAQDEFVNLCLGITHTAGGFNYGQSGQKKTFAGAAINATQVMLVRHGGSTSSNGRDFDSWTVFGDPTLMIRTKAPQEMAIDYLPTIPMGASEFSVDCDEDGALATISYINENNDVIILGTAVVEDGFAEIIFNEPISTTAELTLAVTGFNKVTYLGLISTGEAPELFPPQNLTFTVENANHIVLTWEAPEAQDGFPVRGYNVYRNDELITQEPVRNETSFTDIAPQNGEYEYEVAALYNLSGSLESEHSNPVVVLVEGMCVPLGDKITVVVPQYSGTDVLISWTAPEYEGLELVGYNVFKDDAQINLEIIPATELSFLHNNSIDPEIWDTTYCYHVEIVYNDCEENPISEKECLTILSINNPAGVQTFNIFPNPATGNITVEGAGLQHVEIYDVMGRKEKGEGRKGEGRMELNVSHLPAGIYFVRIFSDANEVVVKRLVVVK